MSDGGVLVLQGPVNIHTVPGLVQSIPSHLRAGVRKIDFSHVTEVDSAAVALALEWRRSAVAGKVQVSLFNVPEALGNLANLYGVADLLEPSSGA